MIAALAEETRGDLEYLVSSMKAFGDCHSGRIANDRLFGKKPARLKGLDRRVGSDLEVPGVVVGGVKDLFDRKVKDGSNLESERQAGIVLAFLD